MSSLPGAYDFHVKAGDPWSDSIIWSINSVPVDLTGYTITLRVITPSGTTSVTCTGNASGVVSWTVPQATIDANIGFTTYDICARSGNGTPNWLLAGTLEVTA